MEEGREGTLDVREEQMVSPTGDSNPTLRMAYFLRPTFLPNENSVPKPPAISPTLPPTFEPKKWPLKVNFKGWLKPKLNWTIWVHDLESKYHSLWKKAGIYEAIMSSTLTIVRDYDFIIGIAEKWCPETNTFIFPWGEATITLEDMIILGGYSVLGSPVASFSDYESSELKEIENKMAEARRDICRGGLVNLRQSKWMEKFINSGSEIEHEAFLSLWLARYVFRDSEMTLRGHFFPIAIQLARGVRIALAPAVLASIYRDLSLLKETIVAATKFERGEKVHGAWALTLWSPMLIVQLWGWERFTVCQPKTLLIKKGEPRCAIWDSVKGVKVRNVRVALDSAGETFRWRPYANPGISGWHFPEFYREKGGWVDMGMNEDLLSFAVCLRVSKLAGLGCIEKYQPHRVAMQFGMDQDIPGDVPRLKGSLPCGLNNYTSPFSNSKIYVPSRLFESDVTIGYLNWWRGSVQDVIEDAIKIIVRGKRSFRKRSDRVPWQMISEGDKDLDVPPGFPPKSDWTRGADAAENIKTTLEDIIEERGILNDLERRLKTSCDFSGPAQHPLLEKTGGATFDKSLKTANSYIPSEHLEYNLLCPLFTPKCEFIETLHSDGKDDITVKELLVCNSKCKIVGLGANDAGKSSSATSHSLFSAAENNDAVYGNAAIKLNENCFHEEPKISRSITMENSSMIKLDSLSSMATHNASSLHHHERQIRSRFDIHTDGLALEARIKELRKEIDELMTAKFGQRC